MLDSLPATGPEIAEGTLATVSPTLVVGGLGVSGVALVRLEAQDLDDQRGMLQFHP